MAPPTSSRRPKALPRPRRDPGRFVARLLCAVLAVVGVVPLALGVLVRTERVRAWAARETEGLLAHALGVHARYDVHVQAWPLLVTLEDVRVEASDGKGPFLEVERVAVRPRPFSLLAGKLDAGEVEIVGPRVRAVVAHGALTNLAYKLPATPPKKDEATAGPPLSSVSVTDARLDLTIDGTRVVARRVDLDVSAEDDGAFELGVRTGTTAVTRTHPMPGYDPPEDAVDEDVVCRLDARVRLEPGGVLVRRLLAKGSADFDPDPGTAPGCQLPEGDWRAFEVSLGGVRVRARGASVSAGGRVHAVVPLALAHRFVALPHTTGSLTVDAEGEWDGSSRLPAARAHVTADRPGLDGKVFATKLALDVETTPAGVVSFSNLDAAWADGHVRVHDGKLEPFAKGMPLSTGPVLIEGIEFHALLRDLGVHPRAHVAWTLDKGRFERFGGTLSPLALDGPLTVSAHGFEIFNKPVVDPARGHMIGVRDPATVRGTFQIRPQAVVLNNFSVDTPRSHVRTTVSIGFKSFLELDVFEGSKIELAELSPVVDIPMSGLVSVHASGRGDFDHPKFTGEIGIHEFSFGGFSVGDVESKVAFEPLVLELDDAHVKKNESRVHAPLVRIAFDKGHDVLVDADVDTHEAPHLGLRDFFEVFRFDKDPRFADIAGAADGRAHVHYALNGPEDRCGGGLLDVRAVMDVAKVQLFGESYASGHMDLDFKWDDQLAGDAGMSIDMHAMSLRKGSGSVLGSFTVRHGGVLQGNAIATGLPVSSIDALGALGKKLDGSVSLVADLGGTLGAMQVAADVSISKLRIGPSTLPPSRLRVAMTPSGPARKVIGRTRCGDERSPPFSLDEWQKDASTGAFHVDGQLFEGQIKLSDVTITEQRHKVVAGKVAVNALDLGTLANLVPGVAFSGGAPPRGSLTASVDVKSLPVDAPSRADVTLQVSALEVERDKNTAHLLAPSGPIVLRDYLLNVPDLRIEARGKNALSVVLVAGGRVLHATTAPELDVGVTVEPIDLSRLSATIAGVDRAAGTFDADLRVSGPIAQPRYGGSAHLRKGELALKSPALSLDDVNVDVDVAGGDLRVRRATAKLGGGTLEATARMSLRGKDAGAATATLSAKGVKVAVAEGVNLTADADLEASYAPSARAQGQRPLPDVKGTVSLTSFSYTRPIVLSVDLSQLGRQTRTVVDTYDPANDVVHFTINVVSPRPLRVANNLVDMKLEVLDPGIVLSGTNQRFGARGGLRVLADSKLQLRNSEFSVKEGIVRFDDPTRISPIVDVRAQTEYRRYASSAMQDSAASATEGAGATSASSPGASTTASTIASSGIWRITLHAHGDAENLKVDLSSDPTLSQEDIVLLLSVGMTRAELDRSASALGESVGLEALSSLTGADKAVKTAVPVIDEFRFGSWYSSVSGQIEPTVTLGKRLTDNVRATVTTGITENREVQSNIEWKLNRRMSIEGTYDNLNQVSSSSIGNIGADLRWHIDFE
ncbi:MAG TPA: translocation/assembly module TamB domain-containing protein [Minicystis sp.]|nr:translocation/assembly module TamB domain-containing protein [Minicystis sp.]